jgi:hypothetical protein
MARRTFDVIDVTEILVHWHAGRSLNEMSASLGWTARRSGSTSLRRSWPVPSRAGGQAKTKAEWQDLVRGWFPELSNTRLRQVTWRLTTNASDSLDDCITLARRSPA